MEISKMNELISESSEKSFSEGGESEPPDSLNYKTKNKLLEQEPASTLGSFLVAETVSDLDRCHELWEKFSSNKHLFDTWEFRYAFYTIYQPKLHFILLKESGEEVALLPLWQDSQDGKYYWFGSAWQEENNIFAKDKKYVPTLLSLAPAPLMINAVPQKDMEAAGSNFKFEPDDSKYILNLEGLKTHEDFLMTLKKNDRHDLRKDRRRIERQNPQIIIDNFSDFQELVRLTKKRFEEKGEKSNLVPERIKVFEEAIKLSGKSYKARMITIKINGQTAAVDLICYYKGVYSAIKCGYDVKSFSGIGNFMNLYEIDDAISLGMQKVDFLQNNYKWKSRWFEAVPLFKYSKD